MKLKHVRDGRRDQRPNGSPRAALTAALFFFSLIVALHLGASRLQAATVNIVPGENIADVVNSHPPDTTFVIHPGLYRLQKPIIAKDGDSFIGQTACSPPTIPCQAILNGARLLTSFERSGLFYHVSGQTQQGQVTIDSSKCEPAVGYPEAYPGCIYPEDLYFDNVPLVHVTTLTDVGPGKWFFDYRNNTIYFYDNPADQKVETSVTPSAFAWGPANNVTIQGLTLEKFAVPIQDGVIAGNRGGGSFATGLNWIVRNNEIRLNHGNGVNINYGWQILNNYIHTNGDLGIAGGLVNTAPSRVLIQGNEIAFNNYAHVSPHFGAGGADVTMTNGVFFKGNYVHNNEGSGLWMDTNNVNGLYDGNTIQDNTEQGIFHERSYAATVRNNKLLRNGYIHPTGSFWLFGANLLSSTSEGVEAYCNTVEISAQGGNGMDIIGQPLQSGGGPITVYTSQNNYFHHNTVVFDGASGWTGAARGSKTDICCRNFYDVNKFDYNTYYIPFLSRMAFAWDNKLSTFAQFRDAGPDAHGSAHARPAGSAPNVVITSLADRSKVSGVVDVQGNAQDDISKVELYVDWKLQQTTSTNPFSFAWNTNRVAKGNHTVAAMAYDTEGMPACYAVLLQVQ